ncbi:unnamed protein product [Caenorhabditis bovis]|uniref:Uncharacterized protein n=1 Tax=Caenorhabditis bovis TaxID=2654633 RepID=A0A8S1FDL1_9PELO|nr:unnamed protein product [Caenorhabditis bovis]
MNFSIELSSLIAVFALLVHISSAAVVPADYSPYARDVAEMPPPPSSFVVDGEPMPPVKRAQTFVRFGKRAQTFVRFGKRGQTFVRFGRSAPISEE